MLSVKPLTVRLAVAVRLSEPLTPVTVNVTTPGGVVAAVLTVRVEVPGADGFGAKLHAAPLGRPLQERFTVALKPPLALIETA